MTEAEQREEVVRVAMTWLRTPYHHMGRVKGVGADCATFPAEVYAACGVVAPVPIDFYPPDWHLHRDTERYLNQVLDHATEIPESEAAAGDFVMWRIGRALAHGAIVIAWPRVIHAVVGIGVSIDDGRSPTLRFGRKGERERHFYSPWIKETPQ